MSVTPEQLDALERWAAQSPFPVVNIATEFKAQKQRIAGLEALVERLQTQVLGSITSQGHTAGCLCGHSECVYREEALALTPEQALAEEEKP